MPVQIDYENQIFNILESFEIDGDIEDVIKKQELSLMGSRERKVGLKRDGRKINNLVEQRAPWLAKKSRININ